jgi:hypothetical protein
MPTCEWWLRTMSWSTALIMSHIDKHQRADPKLTVASMEDMYQIPMSRFQKGPKFRGNRATN